MPKTDTSDVAMALEEEKYIKNEVLLFREKVQSGKISVYSCRQRIRRVPTNKGMWSATTVKIFSSMCTACCVCTAKTWFCYWS